MVDSTWVDATVTALGPLRVRIDGDATAVPFEPDSLVDPAALSVSDRVRCELAQGRVIIHGRARGVKFASVATTIDGAATDQVVTPAGLRSVRPFKGVIDPLWTFGKPNVTLDDGSATVVSAFLPPSDADIQPGSTVLLERLPGGVWYIVSAVASAPSFLRQIPLVGQNNWGDGDNNETINGSRYGRPRVTKSATGWVMLAGLINKKAAGGVAGEVITTLPVGMRPTRTMRFPCLYNAGGQSLYLIVEPTGEVKIPSAIPSGNYVGLANVVFNPDIAYTPITLLSGWASQAGHTMQLGKDAFGIVSVMGAVQSGTLGGKAWNVPAGFEYDTALSALATSNSPYIPTVNTATGAFVTANSSLTSGMLPQTANTQSLDGLSYLGLGNTAGTWKPFQSFQNAWVAFGGGYGSPGFQLSPDGIVRLTGLIKSGALNTTALYLPEGLRPKTIVRRLCVANSAVAWVDIMPDGQIIPRVGSNAWFSFDGLAFAPEQ